VTHILIIDGDKAVGTAIKLWLEVEGAEVAHIPDIRAGIEAIRSDRFDLLIVDLSIPGIDRLDTMRVVHQIRPTMPIIGLSGLLNGLDQLPGEGSALGATRILTKPFKPRDLMGAIEAALGRSLEPPQALRPHPG